MKKLQDFIRVYDNVFPAQLASQLMEMTASVDTAPWQPAGMSQGFDATKRDTLTIFLGQPVIQQQTPWINEGIHSAVKKVRDLYVEEFPAADSATEDTGYELLRYLEGGFYTEHLDCDSINPRMLSISFLLNDGYEGGEFCFYNKQLVFKPPALSAIVFPSNFQFPHEISPVTQGERWSIVTWLK